MTDAKDELRFYRQGARDALVWKVDGLSEYDIRRPLTPTGTNLLGLVKHATFVGLRCREGPEVPPTRRTGRT